MKQISTITFESDADKVFENINTKERTWGICLGVDDSIDNWSEVPATEEEIRKREERDQHQRNKKNKKTE